MTKRIFPVAVAALAVSAVTASAAHAAPARISSGLPTVSFALNGKTVTGPKTVPAGAVNVSVTTTKEKEGSLALVKLAPGVTIQQAFARVGAAHGDPNALNGYATVVADGDSPAGTPSTFQTTLTPGRYAALDFAPNGQPPVTAFTVKGGKGAAMPHAAATLKEIEFAFEGPSSWHDGEVVRFENDGYVVHMVIGLPFPSRAAAKKAMALLVAGKDHAAGQGASGAPVEFVGGNSPGGMQQQKITAKPGVYVIACFMATGDGREHTRLGMEKMVTISK